MSNSYFKFKQFTINQDKSAMKVCTDACLFGAWTADKIESEIPASKDILDIGTGTGLLSLMLAQKTKAHIYAVEIDLSAAEQAEENFKASHWKDRLTLINSDIKSAPFSKTFDVIISNPPFFENDLISADSQRNLALHSHGLTLQNLGTICSKLLSTNGNLFFLLPYHRNDYFQQIAESNSFFVKEKVLIRQTEKHAPFRSMLWLTQIVSATKQTEIIIKQNGQYSTAFTELLKDYYLYL